MKLMQGLLLIFLFSAFHSSVQAKFDESQIEECLTGHDPIICDVILSQLQGQERWKEALKVAYHGCNLGGDTCSQISLDTDHLGAKEKAEAQIYFEKRCKEDVAKCRELTGILEDQKKYSELLIVSRKYFQATKEGIFPLHAFKYGDKKEAYSASLDACKAKAQDCAFYLRYFGASHPNLTELLDAATKACENQGLSEGSSECAIVGSYFLKKGNPERAYEMWSKDCLTNATACRLIIAAFKNDVEKTKFAFSHYCNDERHFFMGNEQEIRIKVCAPQQYDKVPALLLEDSQRSLNFFLKEQT